MTTVALTPLPTQAAVRIEIGAAPAGPVTITRSDVNGSNPVRLYAGQEPIAGDLTVTDYEVALAGTVTYSVTDSAGTITAQTTTSLGIAVPWLGVPVLPGFNAPLLLVVDYTATRASSTTLHTVVGRADRVAVIGRLLGREGRFRLRAVDHAHAQALVDLYNRGEVVQLRQPNHDRLDLMHVATGVTYVHDPEHKMWWVDVDYTEVAAPVGPLLGSLGWTFEDVAVYGTFDAVRRDFATFADLLVGP